MLNICQVFPLELTRNNNPVDGFLATVHSGKYEEIHENIGAILHPNEAAHFRNLIAEKRKLSYLLGRCVVKFAVSKFLYETNLAEIEIAFGTFEQPIVKHLSADVPEVTLSHCDNIATAIAVQQGHIMGIDVEGVDFAKTHVFRSQITDAEAEKAEQSFDDARIGYHLIWTAKEALSKALKCGLTVPFSILQVETIRPADNTNGYVLTYKNFAQYKCLSWEIDNFLLSITLPQKTRLSLDLKALVNFGQDKN